ncbi:MAG TPA: nodulation protein NfeD, partial [Anaeromyxobacter sp.]|nr:nodulation protein NfeD [Anaeromyxobacter sp.]
MRRAAAALAALLALAALGAGPAAPGPAAPRVLTVEVNGVITGGTAEYLLAALAKAKTGGYAALAVTLDTPGGVLDATREIVQAMLASDIPVIVWVGPAGARAGSAGVFLTLAADVAAMHPTSNIGAAHPVTGSGRDVAEEAGKDM